jgi:peptidoglycan/LPS O-acetylase OafA/YrhL
MVIHRRRRLSVPTLICLGLAMAWWIYVLALSGAFHDSPFWESIIAMTPVCAVGMLLCGWSPILRRTRLLIAFIASFALTAFLIALVFTISLAPTPFFLCLACVSEGWSYEWDHREKAPKRWDTDPTAQF